jgi:hypothetical protein
MYNILVQGPLNDTSLKRITEYQTYGHVVISYWNKADEKLSNANCFKKLREFDNVTLVDGDEPNNKTQKPIDKTCQAPHTTFFKAITSQYNGLKACTQPYVIKMRSDENYTLRPLIKRFEQDTSKIVFGNIFYKHNAYHIGDHLFVGSTQVLLQAIKQIYDFYWGIEERQEYWELLVEKRVWNCAEIVLAKSILLTLGLNTDQILDQEFVTKFIHQHFDIIDINELNPFIARYSSKTEYKNKFDEKGGYLTATHITETQAAKESIKKCT